MADSGTKVGQGSPVELRWAKAAPQRVDSFCGLLLDFSSEALSGPLEAVIAMAN